MSLGEGIAVGTLLVGFVGVIVAAGTSIPTTVLAWLQYKRLVQQEPSPSDLTADLKLSFWNLTWSSFITFTLHNQGRHSADDVRLTVSFHDWHRTPSPLRSIQPKDRRDYKLSLASVVGQRTEVDGVLVQYPAASGVVRVEYEDGTGPQVLEWTLDIGPGTDLASRNIHLTPIRRQTVGRP